MTKYLSCAETAKIIREELKKNFKGIKFSVRSKTYSGGASIRVEWLDGPSTTAVERVAKRFQGATFDSSIDLKSYVKSEWNGEEVHFGADYVFCERNYSHNFIETILPQFCKRYGLEMPEIKGTDDDAWLDGIAFEYHERGWWNELIRNTDAKDMHRVFEAEEEQEVKQRAEWEAAYKAEQEREARERAEAEQKRREEEAKAERERLAREQAEFEKWCSKYFTSPIWDLLDMTEKKELYRRWKVVEEVKKKEAQKQAEEKARRQREQAERDRQQEEQAKKEEYERRQNEQAMKRSILSSKSKGPALAYMGLTFAANRVDILAAFRAKVKAMSDGKGGYKGDMDFLVKVKEKCMQ